MSELNKEMILNLLRESNCIETPILNRFFKSVWVGEVLRQRLETVKRKMKIN